MSEAAVTTALRTARMAIGDTGKEQRLIRTVFRRGYQFVGTVVQTAAVDGSGTRHDVPLPARLAASPGLGFAGREHERTVLADAWKDVLASGRRRVVLVSGEAGIGKTTLCSVFAAAKQREAAVLYGRCDEELSIPYQPWREVLTGLDREAPGLAEAMRLASPLGRLSRARAGTVGTALVLNLPGSSKGCVETLDAVLDVIPHALELLAGGHPH